MLVLNLPAFKNKKYTAYDRFHGNGLYGKIPTKKEPIRMLGFALPYNKSLSLKIKVKLIITIIIVLIMIVRTVINCHKLRHLLRQRKLDKPLM